jgi:hypothetical protein
MNIQTLADPAQDGAEIPLLQVAVDGTIEHHTRKADALPIAVRQNTAPLKDPYERIILPGLGVDFDNISDFSCSKKLKESRSMRSANELQDAENLYKYIIQYLNLLPVQIYMRVRGSRRDRSQPQNIVVDFDFCVPLRGLDGTHCGEAFKTTDWFHILVKLDRAPGIEDSVSENSGDFHDLRKWCDLYCAHKSIRKSFQVTRDLSYLDFDAIGTGVTSLLRPQYLGKVEIGFTQVDKHVHICPPNALAQIQADVERTRLITDAVLIPIYTIGILWGLVLLTMSVVVVLTFFVGDEGEAPSMAAFWFRGLCYYGAAALTSLVLKQCLNTIFVDPYEVKRWNNYTIIHAAKRSDKDSAAKHPGLREAQWVRAYAGLLRRLAEGNFEGNAASFMAASASR